MRAFLFFIQFYFLTFFALLWIFISFSLGCLLSLFRWKDPNVLGWSIRLCSKGVLFLFGIKVEFENFEEIKKNQPAIFMGNHRSMLDVMTFGARCPEDLVLIGKKELMWMPLFGFLMFASGQVLLDRQNLKKAVDALTEVARLVRAKGFSVAIAPEGTRNKGGGLLPFKKGGFHLAVATGFPIVPMVSAPLQGIFDWDGRVIRSGTLRIRVLPPIHTTGLTSADVDSLIEKTRNEMLKAFEEYSKKS